MKGSNDLFLQYFLTEVWFTLHKAIITFMRSRPIAEDLISGGLAVQWRDKIKSGGGGEGLGVHGGGKCGERQPPEPCPT